MVIAGHLICLLRNLYAGQEATVRTGHETMGWLKIRKGLLKGYILSLYLFNLYAEYIIWNVGLDEAQVDVFMEFPCFFYDLEYVGNLNDYILCSQKWRSFIQSAKTRPGTDCGSDHQLLIAKFSLKLKKTGKNH